MKSSTVLSIYSILFLCFTLILFFSFHSNKKSESTLIEIAVQTTLDSIYTQEYKEDDLLKQRTAKDITRLFPSFISGSCVLRQSRTAHCYESHLKVNMPAETKFLQISSSAQSVCAITLTQQQIICWGQHGLQEWNGGIYTQIAVGSNEWCALKSTSAIECSDLRFQSPQNRGNIFIGSFQQIVSNKKTTFCGITQDNYVQCIDWSTNDIISPTLQYIQIDLADDYACGISLFKKINCWKGDGQLEFKNNYLQVAVSNVAICAIKDQTYTLECWPPKETNETWTIPPPISQPFQMISSFTRSVTDSDTDSDYFCGLNYLHYITCWGSKNPPQLTNYLLPTVLIERTNSPTTPYPNHQQDHTCCSSTQCTDEDYGSTGCPSNFFKTGSSQQLTREAFLYLSATCQKCPSNQEKLPNTDQNNLDQCDHRTSCQPIGTTLPHCGSLIPGQAFFGSRGCDSGQYVSGAQLCEENSFTKVCASCSDCPTGKYKDGGCSLEGISSCKECPIGKYLTTTGNNQSTACQTCPGSHYDRVKTGATTSDRVCFDIPGQLNEKRTEACCADTNTRDKCKYNLPHPHNADDVPIWDANTYGYYGCGVNQMEDKKQPCPGFRFLEDRCSHCINCPDGWSSPPGCSFDQFCTED